MSESLQLTQLFEAQRVRLATGTDASISFYLKSER